MRIKERATEGQKQVNYKGPEYRTLKRIEAEKRKRSKDQRSCDAVKERARLGGDL